MLLIKPLRLMAVLLTVCVPPICMSSFAVAQIKAITTESPFYQVDPNATGPRALADLQINIPDEIDKQLSDKNRNCTMKKIAELAEEAGDPESVDMAALGYLPADFDRWEKLRP